MSVQDFAFIENQQQPRYPGLRVWRDGEAIVVHVPVRFRRRMGRQMIFAPEGQDEAPQDQANRPLAMALARAHRWQAQLEVGEYAGLEDLAQANGVNRSYVGRMLRLTSLAPDLVEAILRGEEPGGMSLEKLRKELPVVWEEQRERWG